MYPSYIPKGISFIKILGGISKTLNVAGQLIPLYNQAKPVISNAKNILGVLKNFNDSKVDTKDTPKNVVINSEKKENSSNANNPTFFI